MLFVQRTSKNVNQVLMKYDKKTSDEQTSWQIIYDTHKILSRLETPNVQKFHKMNQICRKTLSQYEQAPNQTLLRSTITELKYLITKKG